MGTIKGKRLQEIIEKNTFVPAETAVVITANPHESENGLEVVTESDEDNVSVFQHVIAAGTYASQYKPGTEVYLNLSRLVSTRVNPDTREQESVFMGFPLEIDGEQLFIVDRSFIVGHFEQVQTEVEA